ncbi:hypothetical protein [Ruminococcus albus]|uniref:Uncharacterized protein n=1 Tax=Ruminococcus albus TaxID=1264 RepID=A0A1H7HSK2_RUMAL|nr:hypothetical protein [Ruminococcus albus]SEK53164.1 hypothetical protein SAMN05216469_10374 [Ruminococcus albus]
MSRYDRGGEVSNTNADTQISSGLLSKRKILAVIITLAANITAVYYGTKIDSDGGFLGDIGEYIFFLFFGGISAVTDTLWMIRPAVRKSFSIKKRILFTVLLHLIFLASMILFPTGDLGLAVTVFGSAMCGVLDLVWIIHGIKSLYKKHRPAGSPKKMLAVITVVLNISAVVAFLLILIDSQYIPVNMFDCFLILTDISIVINLICLILGSVNRAKRCRKS